MKLDSLETSTSVTTTSEDFLPQKCILFLRKTATNKKAMTCCSKEWSQNLILTSCVKGTLIPFAHSSR